MHILWVKPGGLLPLTAGGRIRSFAIAREVSRRHQLTVLTTHGPSDDPSGLERALPRAEVVSFPHAPAKHGKAGFLVDVARSWLSPLPADLWRWRVSALRREVERRWGAGGVDLCVADFLVASANVPPAGPRPLLLFEHNVEHAIWKRLRDAERSPWRRALLEVEWRKVRRREREALRRADLTVAVSDVDRERLLSLAPTARVEAIGTGVDLEYFRPDGEGRPGALVFTGAMDWQPNEDGIRHFLDAVWPRIRRRNPRVSLTVVGRNPSQRMRALAAEAGARLTGTVPDVRPYVRDAAVYVAPLRIGGGTRLKLFEALAMGKAVVATGLAAEGLPLVSGRHFVLADEPDAFAEAVLCLLDEPERRQALGQAGRSLVESRFSWARVASDFESHCEEAVRRHAS